MLLSRGLTYITLESTSKDREETYYYISLVLSVIVLIFITYCRVVVDASRDVSDRINVLYILYLGRGSRYNYRSLVSGTVVKGYYREESIRLYSKKKGDI